MRSHLLPENRIAKDGCVYLYTEKGHTVEYTTVPDLKGMTPAWANDQIAYCKLNCVARGSMRDNAVVSSQSYEPGESVPKGTTIELEFTVYENSD